jgi:TRAP-type C4-dicarboxylate transport system permease small subunit
MERFSRFVYRLSKIINVIAGVFLVGIMLLTVSDVILRFFRRPIIGTYEVVSLCGVVAIGFSLPLTQWVKGHIMVDFLIVKMSKKLQNFINAGTRIIGIVFFLLSSSHLFVMAKNLYINQETTQTLRFPFYPVAVSLGVCLFIQCLVLVCQIYEIRKTAGGAE